MSKGPLITRTELRKRREAEEAEQQGATTYEEPVVPIRQTVAPKAPESEAKPKQAAFFRKKRQIPKELTKSRSNEQTKIRARSHKLNKAIIIVSILLVIVVLLVLYL